MFRYSMILLRNSRKTDSLRLLESASSSKYRSRAAAAFALLSGSLFAATQLDPAHYLENVKVLASPQFKGRGTGTPELEKAAGFIARQYRTAGLQPVGGSYFQRYPVTTMAQLGKRNKLTFHNGIAKNEAKFETDFTPLNFSSAGSVTGQIVFAGYGITAPEYNYDDYEGLDVKGKTVILFRREPQEFDEKSVFQGKNYTRHSQFDAKATNARMHGAKAVVMLTDLGSTDLEKFGRTAGPANAGIPFLQLKAETAQKWLDGLNKSLKEIHDEIDKDLKPRSFVLPETATIDIQVDVERHVKQVRNVLGYLPGETDEYVIIGAHYDHLGMGDQFSLDANPKGKIHPGADDNASGSSGVMELARYFASRPKAKRGMLFMAFSGEELGLLGSAYYAEHSMLPNAKAVAMINMDMIGRIRDGKVFVGGSGTGSTLKKILDETRKPEGMKFDMSETAGYGSSDHTSFTIKQIPVLFFFSGLHGDYHRPSDTWDKINAGEAIKLLTYVAAISDKLRGGEDRPQYVRVMPPAGSVPGTAAGSSGGSSGYGPYFGSIPDFAEPPKGVRFADVRDGSPAGKAGLKAGDIMISFDGKDIQNLYDFTYALKAKKVGDEVVVKVMRGTETLEVKVLLTARK